MTEDTKQAGYDERNRERTGGANAPRLGTTKKECKEYLKCALTREEISAAADSMAKSLDDRESLESGLSSVKADFKAKIEKCEAEMKIQQRLVRDKYEFRNVPCVFEHDFTHGTVKGIRLDTGEVITDREMSMAEKQMTMDFSETG